MSNLIILILFISFFVFIIFVIILWISSFGNNSNPNNPKAHNELSIEEKYEELKFEYDKLLSQKKSSEIRTGQIAEQLAPFLKEFKYNPKEIQFLGNPIDYIVFDKKGGNKIEEIVFIEVKSGNSRLNAHQTQIKKAINNGKIRMDEFRIGVEDVSNKTIALNEKWKNKE